MENPEKNPAGQRSDEKNNITLGVELEFLAYIPENEEHMLPQGYVIEALTKKVKMPCNKPGCKEKSHEWLLPMNNADDMDVYKLYNGWSVTTDGSVGHDPDTEANHMRNSIMGNLEIVSRVINFDRPTPCPHGQIYPCTGEKLEWIWQDEINIILQALHSAFNKPGFRVHVNASTGLHVHIGHDSFGLPIHVVQGMMGTFTALEHVFDQIITTDRISGYDGQLALPGSKTTTKNDSPPWNKNVFCTALSNIMFNHLEDGIQDEFESYDLRREGATMEVAGDWDTTPTEPFNLPESSLAVVEGNWNVEPTFSWAEVGIKATGWEETGSSADWSTEVPALPTTDGPEVAETEAVPPSPSPPPSPPPPPAPEATEANLQASATIRQHLRKFNVPAWLHIIFSQDSVAGMRKLWATGISEHYTSLNLENLSEPMHGRPNLTPLKNTAEIRIHAGSLDATEIIAWIDFCGSLTHWLDSHSSVHNYLELVWADPMYTFLDLVKTVAASPSTMSHYADFSNPDYAQRRHDRLISAPHNTNDDLHALTRAIEANRLALSHPNAITQRILAKLASGRYGQYPLSFLRAKLPKFHPADFLDIDSYDRKAWYEVVDERWREVHGGARLLVEAPVRAAFVPAPRVHLLTSGLWILER